jgi:hypothetical protein
VAQTEFNLTKTPKTLPQLLKEIKEEIRVTKKCMREEVKKKDYESALESKRSIQVLEFVLDLASGKLG